MEDTTCGCHCATVETTTHNKQIFNYTIIWNEKKNNLGNDSMRSSSQHFTHLLTNPNNAGVVGKPQNSSSSLSNFRLLPNFPKIGVSAYG